MAARGRGRPPKLRIAKPKKAAKCPSPPVWLPKYGKAEWKRVAPVLWADRQLSDELRALFEAYCLAVARVRECEEIIREAGLIVPTEYGPKQNPAALVQRQSMSQARMLASKLGLSAESREAEEDDDELSELLA